jgi:hypothetical protein
MPKAASLIIIFLMACAAHGGWHYAEHRRYEAAVDHCRRSYASYPRAFQYLCRVTARP